MGALQPLVSMWEGSPVAGGGAGTPNVSVLKRNRFPPAFSQVVDASVQNQNLSSLLTCLVALLPRRAGARSQWQQLPSLSWIQAYVSI